MTRTLDARCQHTHPLTRPSPCQPGGDNAHPRYAHATHCARSTQSPTSATRLRPPRSRSHAHASHALMSKRCSSVAPKLQHRARSTAQPPMRRRGRATPRRAAIATERSSTQLRVAAISLHPCLSATCALYARLDVAVLHRTTNRRRAPPHRADNRTRGWPYTARTARRVTTTHLRCPAEPQRRRCHNVMAAPASPRQPSPRNVRGHQRAAAVTPAVRPAPRAPLPHAHRP